MSDPQLRQARRIGRPCVLTEEFRRLIDAWFLQQPLLKASEILRRLVSDHGYQGGKNPVYEYVASHRPPRPPAPPIVRFEGVAGEFAQHDFGSLTVTYTDGRAEKLVFYAGRLKYSRMMHVCLIDQENAEGLIRGLEAFAQAVGGLPLINVVDNTKAAVLRRKTDPTTGQERIQYNEHFASFLREVGVFAEPTYPYSGNQKGSVESLVKFVKGAFLTVRQFTDRADLLTQLEAWLHYVNQVRACEATGQIPAVRLLEERDRLRALPFGPRGYGLAYPAVVGPDGRVSCQGYTYSTPAAWIGQPIVVRVHRHHVVLQHSQAQVEHPRIPENGRYSLLPEHRRFLFLKPRGMVMAKRQILMDLCPEAEQFFTELVHRRPQLWREQDLPLVWELFERLEVEEMIAAFRHCLASGAIGGEYLRAVVEGLGR
jgi:transposase